MSDRPTPLTDAFMLTAASGYPRQCCDFARDLERQLAEAKEAKEKAYKLLHEARRDYSGTMSLYAYERIQEAIHHLTP